MSKWLQSNTNLNYTANGKLIGKTPVQLSDAEYEKISKMPVIASLLKNGAIKVLDKYAPATTDASTAKLQALTEENARLADKVRQLEAEGKGDEKSAALEAKVKEVEAKAAEAQQAYETMAGDLQQLQSQYDALKAEAEAKIAELQSQLDKKSSSKKKAAEE